MSQKNLTRKLYFVVFLTGVIVMILELIGSRILGPSLGTSIYVWASIIGVILGAMSLGYYYGGKLADKDPDWKTLSHIIFLSGFFVFTIIILKQSVLDLSTFLGIKAGAIFASSFLFLAPSFLLGMVSPYAVRLTMENVENSGRTVGNLYAVSTFASIIGIFSAVFYFIPHFGNVNILYGLAISLFAIGIFCHNGGKRKNIGIGIIVAFLCGFSMNVEAKNHGRYIFEQDSAYNHIRVFETVIGERPVRVMSVEDFFDSGMYLDGDELVFDYTKYYALDEAFAGEIKKAAMFGGAAYSVPKYFLQNNTRGVIDVVELDPKTTEVAKQYFKLEEDPRMNIIHDDARIFLNDAVKSSRGEYDSIYNDAFSSACALSSTLVTREAIQEAYDVLDEDGVYIVNISSSLEGEKSIFFRAEYKTIAEVFEGVYVFRTKDVDYSVDDVQNIMVVATKNTTSIEQIREDFAKRGGDKEIAALLDNYWPGTVETDDVAILTDDFSPVSYYAAAVCKIR